MAEPKVNLQPLSDEKLKELTDAIDSVGDIAKDANEVLKEVKAGPVSQKTIISLVVTVAVTLNTVFVLVGSDFKLDLDISYQVGSVIAMIANLAWAFWNNHDITVKARKKTALLDKITKG